MTPRGLTSLGLALMLMLACSKLEAPSEQAYDEATTLAGEESGRGFAAAKAPARPAAPLERARPEPERRSPGQPARRVIRNGNVSLEVGSVEAALDKVKSFVDSHGGYISNETLSEDRFGRKSGSVTCRVPSEKLDQVVEAVKHLGKVENVSISANDVTEQYYDLETRIANQKALEKRLLDLLQRQAKKLSDLLEIERELARVRTQLDSMEGRKRLWDNQIAYSTLSVSVHEPLPVVAGEKGGVWRTLVRSFKRAGDNFVLTVASIISGAGSAIPILALGLALWWLWRAWKKRRRETPSVAEGAGGKAGTSGSDR